MKKGVLFFCFVMLSVLAIGQPVSQYLGSPTTAVKTRGIHIIDSVLVIPKRLSGLFKDTGAVYYRIADSSIQAWTGSQWIIVGGPDGTKVPLTRTITINGNTQDLSANRTWTLTKSDIGLGNVDNTSDLNKPVSTAQQTALNDTAEDLRSAIAASIVTASEGLVKDGGVIRIGRLIGGSGGELTAPAEVPLNNQTLYFSSPATGSTTPYTSISKNGIEVNGDYVNGSAARLVLNNNGSTTYITGKTNNGTAFNFNNQSQLFVQDSDGKMVFTPTPGALPTAFHDVDGTGRYRSSLLVGTTTSILGGDLKVEGTAGSASIISTNALGSTSGGVLNLGAYGAFPSPGNRYGAINFYTTYTGNSAIGSSIEGVNHGGGDPNSGVTGGSVLFKTKIAGSPNQPPTESARINGFGFLQVMKNAGTTQPWFAIHVRKPDAGTDNTIASTGFTYGGGGKFYAGIYGEDATSGTDPLSADEELGRYGFGIKGAYTGMMGAFSSAAWSGTSRPTYLSFQTTPTGSNTPVSRLKIHDNGNVELQGANKFFSDNGRIVIGQEVDPLYGISYRRIYDGVTQANFTTTVPKYPLYIDKVVNFADDSMSMAAVPGDDASLSIMRYNARSVLNLENTVNRFTADHAVLSFGKVAGFADTTIFRGRVSPSSGLLATMPSGFSSIFTMSQGGLTSTNPNIVKGWVAALSTEVQLSGLYNQMENAIWLYAGLSNGGANTITNGYGLYVAGMTNSVVNKYAIYQQGSLDTNYFAGKIKFAGLTGTGTRISTISASGVAGAIANGTDGQILTMVSGSAAWANNASVQTTGNQTVAGIKTFTDRMAITKGAGITPDPNNLLYLGRNEPGNFFPLGIFEDATDDGYAQFGVWGKARKWNFGVGNGPSNFFGVQDKFYVLDATSNNIRFSIDTDGTVEIPELLKAKGNVATRIRAITTSTTIDEYDHTILIDASGGPITVTLPTSASSYYGGYGITYIFKRIDNSGNTITIAAAGSDTIDGGTTAGLNTTALQTITIQAAGGTAWFIIKN